MTTMSDAGPRTAFRVDGAEYGGGGRFTSAWDGMAMVLFAADAGQVARLLPSPELHPMRWIDGRAVVMIDAYCRTLSVGDLPALRYGQMYILAWVTHGPSSAPRLMPALGLGLPVVGDRLNRRYQTGAYMLASIMTNRVAAEIGRVLLGETSTVGEIRLEQGPGHLRYTALDHQGNALHLQVPTGRRSQSADSSSLCSYSARGPDLLRQSLHNSGKLSLRLGRSSALLDLGHHPWAALARGLGMSTRPGGSATWSEATETMERLDRVGTTDHKPGLTTGPEPVEAPFVVRAADGTEEQVDQGLDRLPFDPAGDFQPAAD